MRSGIENSRYLFWCLISCRYQDTRVYTLQISHTVLTTHHVLLVNNKRCTAEEYIQVRYRNGQVLSVRLQVMKPHGFWNVFLIDLHGPLYSIRFIPLLLLLLLLLFSMSLARP